MDLQNDFPELFARISEMTEVGRYLWDKGWAESNGGNLSVDVSAMIPDAATLPAICESKTLPRAYPHLCGRVFLVTGSGHRFRDFAKSVEQNACLLRLNESGEGYDMLWGGCKQPGFRPTSEFPTHLLIHDFQRESGSDRTVVLHTHPTELIALTHLPDYRTEDHLNRALWSMLPEVKVLVPRGAGFVPYEIPGSQELADATVDAIRRGHDTVLWEMHGCLAVGRDIMHAFDLIDTLNKAAHLVILCRSTGYIPRGLSQRQIDELAKAFNLDS